MMRESGGRSRPIFLIILARNLVMAYARNALKDDTGNCLRKENDKRAVTGINNPDLEKSVIAAT